MMTDTTAIQKLNHLARPEVRDLPAYNGGLLSDVARLASNENTYGPSPAVPSVGQSG